MLFLSPHFPSVSDAKPPREIRGKTWNRKEEEVAEKKQKNVREAWTEDASTCVPVCPSESYVPELKGNHVSDIHLGLFAALDQLRHAGQNARWDTNASLSCSQNWPATFTGIKKEPQGFFTQPDPQKTQQSVLFFFFKQLQDFFFFLFATVNCPKLVRGFIQTSPLSSDVRFELRVEIFSHHSEWGSCDTAELETNVRLVLI